MARKIWLFELVGISFIVVVGSLLHFAFAWSDYWVPVALVAAVNESVWEHLKLAFWPGLVWAIFEWLVLHPNGWQYWSAKGFGLVITAVLIVSIFYLYTALLGRNMLVLDIATFVVAIAVGQVVSARLINRTRWHCYAIAIGSGLLVCQLIAYSTFTFYPPPFSIFEDSRDGTRGIPTVVRHPGGIHGSYSPVHRYCLALR